MKDESGPVRGDIYYIEYYPTEGSEQRPGRPAVIVSNDKNNRYSSVVEVVYLTTQPKTALPTHVQINTTKWRSTVLCEQVSSLSVERLGDKLGHCSDEEMKAINDALMVSLDIRPGDARTPELSVRDETELAVYKQLYYELLERLIQ